MPVEIWSRFMREAHQGVPVASLPGSSGGGLFSGLFGGNAPAPRRSGAAGRRRRAASDATTGTASLDGWLIDNLFGRSRN